ncbi:MAG: diaminopimelate epimerase [Paludibacteraceae bacterium]
MGKIRFAKMHGIGNDYIYVNCMEQPLEQPEHFARLWSDRHTGIGSDGLILILPSETCDFRMRMFNADGSEAEMCGNAARCIGKYVYDFGLTQKKELTLETKAGVRPLRLFTDAQNRVECVTVDMGEPILDTQRIPVDLPERQVVDEQVFIADEVYDITCVSMGNPHTVIFADGIDKMDLARRGAAIEYSELFPQRTNVEFVEVVSRNHLRMRVWERGAGETMACGTGACAALVAAVLNGKTDRDAEMELLGGKLRVTWKDDNHVYMTGSATLVYEGEIEQ